MQHSNSKPAPLKNKRRKVKQYNNTRRPNGKTLRECQEVEQLISTITN